MSCALIVAGFLGGAVAVLIADTERSLWGSRLPAAIVLVATAPVIYLMGFRPGVEIDADNVTVRPGLGLGRTIRFPTGDLERASGGTVLRLHRRSDGVIQVRAVANMNTTLLRRRSGRTEHVASEINDFLQRNAASHG